MTTYVSMQPPVGQSPVPSTVKGFSGTSYAPDANGVFTVQSVDVKDLLNQGWTIQPFNSEGLLGQLLGANFNSTADQLITLYVPATVLYRVAKITVTNASTSLTTAVGGVYTAAAKGGSAIVAAGQAYSNLTTAVKALDLTLALNQRNVAGTPLYLSLSTAQGAAATADVYVFGEKLTQ